MKTTSILSVTAGLLMTATFAHADTTINVIGFSGTFADNYQKFIIAPFEEAHPDIKVNYQPSKNSAETLALLTRQKSDPTIDVALIDVSVAIKANEQDMFTALDAEKVSNLAQQPDWARINDDKTVAFSQDNLVVIYNTNNIKEPPTSWSDLADPKYKGRIAARLADTRGVLLIPILDKIAGHDYKETIDPALDAIKSFAPNVSTWDPAPDCYGVVQSGEADLSFCFNGRAQFLHDTQDGVIGIATMKEGSIGQTNTINLVNGTKNADAAQAFINYALSAEAQSDFAEKSFYGPVNTAVTLPQDVAARIYGTKEAQENQMALDWPWIATVYSQWIQRINREVVAFN